MMINITLMAVVIIFTIGIVIMQRRKLTSVIESQKKELDSLRGDYEGALKDNTALKVYADETMHYIGSYPNWKVVQEYRQLLVSLKSNDDSNYIYHLHNIDDYLNKLVFAAQKLNAHYDNCYFFGDGITYITSKDDPKFIENAKADYLLPEIKKLYPEAMNYWAAERLRLAIVQCSGSK